MPKTSLKTKTKLSEQQAKFLAYEEIRKKNIIERENVLKKLDISTNLQELQTIQQQHKEVQATKRKNPVFKTPQDKENGSLGPKRRSLRIQLKDRLFEELTEQEKEIFLKKKLEEDRLKALEEGSSWRISERPEGPLKAEDYCDTEGVESKEFLESCTSFIHRSQKCKQKEKILQTWAKNKVSKQLEQLEYDELRRIKVTKDRCYSIAFHPSVSDSASFLYAVGDKNGQLGLCKYTHMPSSDDQDTFLERIAYHPHSSPINCLQFQPLGEKTTSLVTSSYDGTVRKLDFERRIFDQWYRTSEDGDLCKYFAFHSPQVILVTTHSGKLAVVDSRQKSECATEYTLVASKHRLRTVDVHPTDSHCFTTAGYDGNVHLWDLRALRTSNKSGQASLFCIPHGKGVHSAFFSPVTGNHVLTSSTDDTISVIEVESKSRLLTLKHNNHVGRWLTNFRPIWHPQNEDLFLSGSMDHPRRVEIFSVKDLVGTSATQNITSGRPKILLSGVGSVCSINAVHPKLAVVAGINSSGYSHIWL